MQPNNQALLPSTFLFRFSAPCYYQHQLWSASGIQLDKKYVLPSFGELEGRPIFADLRGAWSETGLAFTVRVTGKKQPPWCRQSRLEDSDGLHLWIDSRNTQNVHRATRFCHHFMCTPSGGGRRADAPILDLLMINRARENPKPLGNALPPARSEKRIDGYLLDVHIPASALTGYDPVEHPRIGFSYAVVDRELGWQTFSVGPELPFVEDPSLWGTLHLVQ